MKYAVVAARILLGASFVVFGANILVPFLPMPPFPAGSAASQFMVVMGPSHWMALVGGFELAGGLLVLFCRTAPLGLAILAPLLTNVLAFHLLLMGGEGVAPGAIFGALELFLLYAYRRNFAGLMRAGQLA